MAEAPNCPETGQPMVRGVRPDTVAYKGRTRTIMMPGWYCDASGESIHTRDDMKVSDRALADLKAEVEGVASPSEVARVRKVLKLTQVQASRVFGGGPRSFQKYESGEVRTTRTMTLALRMAEKHPRDILQMAAEMDEKERGSQQG
ncbi:MULTISPECIES: type II toxin-antitoxin system MqsA family antitoxin [Methylobacteriaceae]|uniref:type II toxin-antitoxin system MqsA family antitoxin n=1 Tax=Methylobacteriaceae TaxID=119045 RepID=UPI000DAAFB9A|nr:MULTISPECIES: type II toxin-antitoxin system MqsA family antitoxin [Methylobacterium]AWV19800.1 XRE family transcriptional regulator [Methylobacterium sp. XJLW]AYO86368.1 type II toxin-antitoxin system MqsA family antitoxin [Methylobacterium brachiatum]